MIRLPYEPETEVTVPPYFVVESDTVETVLIYGIARIVAKLIGLRVIELVKSDILPVSAGW